MAGGGDTIANAKNKGDVEDLFAATEDEDEWEQAVCLRVNTADGSYDLQLFSGERIDTVQATALDCDDPGPIGVGSTVWVDLTQVEWDEDYEDADDDAADDDDEEEEDSGKSSRGQKAKGSGKGRCRGRGRGKGNGKGKGRAGTGGGGVGRCVRI